MAHLKTSDFLIAGAIIILLMATAAALSPTSMDSHVKSPDSIKPSSDVYYFNAQGAGSNVAQAPAATTPEPDDQEDGYSDDNEDLEPP